MLLSDFVGNALNGVYLDEVDTSELEKLLNVLQNYAVSVKKALTKARTRESHYLLANELKEDQEWSFRIVEPSFIDADELSRHGLRCFDYYLCVQMGSTATRSAPLEQLDTKAYVHCYVPAKESPIIREFARCKTLPKPKLLAVFDEPDNCRWRITDEGHLYKETRALVKVVYRQPDPAGGPRIDQSLFVVNERMMWVVPGWDPDCLTPSGERIFPFSGTYKPDAPWPSRALASEKHTAFVTPKGNE